MHPRDFNTKPNTHYTNSGKELAPFSPELLEALAKLKAMQEELWNARRDREIY